MKLILIPDSFKGTLSSTEICGILDKAVKKNFPEAETVLLPIADGGEGSVDAFLSALGGERVFVHVKNPFMEEIRAYYGILPDQKTAVMEMAACAGLPLAEGRKNPLYTTTYGVGEMMLDAARRGVKKIIIGLGGSSTNDGGCGAAAAAGIRFLDSNQSPFIPTGATLCNITEIDRSAYADELKDVEMIAMCDIDNPLYGKNGAAYIFAPQKGADMREVRVLDAGLVHLGKKLTELTGKNFQHIPGAGAAGGMGAGMSAFFSAEIQPGIQVVLDTVQFDRHIQNADYVITGEGNIDRQSIQGKAIAGIAKRAKKQNKPVIVIAGGANDEEIRQVYDMGVTSVFTISRLPLPFEEGKKNSANDLFYTADNVFRLMKLIG